MLFYSILRNKMSDLAKQASKSGNAAEADQIEQILINSDKKTGLKDIQKFIQQYYTFAEAEMYEIMSQKSESETLEDERARYEKMYGGTVGKLFGGGIKQPTQDTQVDTTINNLRKRYGY